jgi:hypothetical protein
VGRRLAENDLKPWRKDVWCISQVDAEYVARMEAPLALAAARMNDPRRPDCLAGPCKTQTQKCRRKISV